MSIAGRAAPTRTKYTPAGVPAPGCQRQTPEPLAATRATRRPARSNTSRGPAGAAPAAPVAPTPVAQRTSHVPANGFGETRSRPTDARPGATGPTSTVEARSNAPRQKAGSTSRTQPDSGSTYSNPGT